MAVTDAPVDGAVGKDGENGGKRQLHGEDHLRLLPPSANWYCSKICDCGHSDVFGLLLAFGAKNSVFIYQAKNDADAHDTSGTKSAGSGLKVSFFAQLVRGKRDRRVTAVQFLTDTTGELRLVCGGEEGSVQIWDVASLTLIEQHRKHKAEVMAITVSSTLDANFVLAGDRQGRISAWERDAGKVSVFMPVSGDGIHSIAISPHDKALVAVGYRSGVLCLVDAAQGTVRHRLDGHDQEVQCVAWKPPVEASHSSIEDETSSKDPGGAGREVWLASSSRDKTIKVWKIALNAAEEPALEQSGLLAVGLSNGVVKVLNWGDNNIEANRFHEHAESITCLTWSKGPNTGLLASGGQDGKIFVYSCAKSTAMDADDNFTPTRQRLHLLGGMEAHSNNVTGLRWCTDVSSGLLASSSADGSVQVWNAASLERVAYFKHHVGRALSLDWVSPYTLVTGGEDQTLRLWDYREQQKDPQTKQKKALKSSAGASYTDGADFDNSNEEFSFPASFFISIAGRALANLRFDVAETAGQLLQSRLVATSPSAPYRLMWCLLKILKAIYEHQPSDCELDEANSEAKAFDSLLQSDAPCGVRELFEFLTRPSGDKGENGVDGLNDSVLSGYATAIHAEEQLSKERVAHRGTHFWCQILSAYQECGYWFDAEGQVRIQEVQNLLVGSNCFVDVEKAVAASANGGQDSTITPLLQAAQRLLRFGIDVLSSSFIGALEHMREACLLLAQSDVRRSVEVTNLPSSGSEEGVGDFQLNLMLLLCPLGFASPKELPQCGELADEPLDTLVLWSSVLLSQCRIVLAAFVKNVSVPENVQLVESLIGSLLRLLRTQFLDEETTKPLSLGLMDHANQSQLQTLLNDILVSAHQLPDILSVVQESCADAVADQDKENKEPLSLKQTLIDDVNDLRSRLTWSADGVKE
ncbi:Gem-associated protein 5 [Phytophthora ramorum]|uniref:Gem-associated protein 5 n=1 Tax=Phytophthora ramorum TaxID=164328 RepID=UPI003094E5C3|nr:Gem-associated protein 5 [Phytophthora ramorum]